MRELEDRLRALEQIPAPDLRDRIRSWQPPAPGTEPVFKRVGVILVSFAIAVGGIALVVEAFRSTEQIPRPGSTIQNGMIGFSAGPWPHADIFVVSPDGSGLTKLVARNMGNETGGVEMAWSPDGTRLAFTDYRPSGATGLFVMDADGGTPVDVSRSLEVADSPTWSPDGTELAFGGCCDAYYDIYVVRADGTGLRRVTDERNDDGAFNPAWSPDGTKIAYVVERYDARSETETRGILTMNTDGTQPEFVTWSSRIDDDPVWSPDGTKIAFFRMTGDGYSQLFVASALDGLTEPTRISSPGLHVTSHPSWSPDSQEVLFSAQRMHVQGIYVASTDGAIERAVLEGVHARGAVLSPDGRWIAFVRVEERNGLGGIWLIRPDGTDLTELVGGLEEEVGGIEWQGLSS